MLTQEEWDNLVKQIDELANQGFGNVGHPQHGAAPTCTHPNAPPGIGWPATSCYYCGKMLQSTTMAQKDDKKEEEKLRRQVLPEYKGESSCRWRYPQPLPETAPRPSARLEDGPHLEKAKAEIRKWCGYGMRQWPTCHHGHEINLGFDESRDSKRGWYVFGFLKCEGCR